MQIILGIFIFFILLAGLEIYSITFLAQYIGFWHSLIIILVTGIIGAFIARKNAKEALKNLMKGDFRSAPPARHMFDVIALFFAAALLLIPGLITDIAGILLLIPWIRNVIYKNLTHGRIARSTSTFNTHRPDPSNNRDNKRRVDEVIDIEAEDA